MFASQGKWEIRSRECGVADRLADWTQSIKLGESRKVPHKTSVSLFCLFIYVDGTEPAE